MNCPKCATTLSAGVEFCGLCGSAALASKPAPSEDSRTELQSDLAAALAIGLQDEPTQMAPVLAAPDASKQPTPKTIPALPANPTSKAIPALNDEPKGPASKALPALPENPKPEAPKPPISKAVPALKEPVSRSVTSLKEEPKAVAVKEAAPSEAPSAPKEEAKVISRAVVSLKEEPVKEEPKASAKKEEPAVKAAPKRRWRRKTVKLKKRLKELKAFHRGTPTTPPPPAPPRRNVPVSSPSQREILLGINEKMSAVATMIRTGELHVVEEPAGGLPSMLEPKRSTNTSDYGSLVSESSLKTVSRPEPKKAPPPPPIKKSDFEDFGAPSSDLPKASAKPVRINTIELMEDPSDKLPSGYAAHVAPVTMTPNRGLDPVVEPVVISAKQAQDSGEISIRKSANKSKTFVIAALALAAGAVGAFTLAPRNEEIKSQSVAAATPPITIQPTIVTVSNDEKISQAAGLAVQGKWEEAAALAEEAQSPDLAKRYRIEGEVSQNLRECRKARDEKKLEAAMAACHLVGIVDGSQSAQLATPEIDDLKKAYKSKHIPLTKKGISRNTSASLSEAKQEIELLSLYLGQESPDVSTLQRLYQEQLKKLSGKEKALAQKESPALAKTNSTAMSSKDPGLGGALTPINSTPTAAVSVDTGGKIYMVNGVYLTLGGFSNRTKDSALSSKYQSAISRSMASSGKIAAPPSGKDPITILGAVTKADTKMSGGNTIITISVSLQVTRNKAILAFLSKDASAEFSGSITPAEEKSGKDEVMKALADGIFADLKKSLPKFK